MRKPDGELVIPTAVRGSRAWGSDGEGEARLEVSCHEETVLVSGVQRIDGDHGSAWLGTRRSLEEHGFDVGVGIGDWAFRI
ncbi:hypothetical protein M0R45_017014 [Rubus argutus]|uniref:Uncharacterized protein n=1 Tax=Rubus argutus TaxID=59490 RepID=A0AAW1XX13_RUBAR